MNVTVVDPKSISSVLERVTEICSRFDKILNTNLQSNVKDIDEERWWLKEATKGFIDDLEKHAVPTSKHSILMIRNLRAGIEQLIEKCQQTFPQLEELGRLKSLGTEIDATLKMEQAGSSQVLPNCPLCVRFGGYRLLGQGIGQSENIFLYVAEKIGSAVPKNSSADFSWSPVARQQDDDDVIRSPRSEGRRRSRTKPRIQVENIKIIRDENEHEAEPDTFAEATPTIHSESSQYDDDAEKKKNLLWMDDLKAGDEPDKAIHQKRKRRSRRRSRSQESSDLNERVIVMPAAFGQRHCDRCPESPTKNGQAVTPPPSPPPPPTPTPSSSEDRPVDLIVSATVGGNPPGLSFQVQEKTPTSAPANWIYTLMAVLLLNLFVSLLIKFWNNLTSTTNWPGSMIWPIYCNTANKLCKKEYDFACSDYCSSRLDRELWSKKY